MGSMGNCGCGCCEKPAPVTVESIIGRLGVELCKYCACEGGQHTKECDKFRAVLEKKKRHTEDIDELIKDVEGLIDRMDGLGIGESAREMSLLCDKISAATARIAEENKGDKK